MPSVTRRQLLAGRFDVTARGPEGFVVHPRSSWGADLPPRGPLIEEDVRFLIVHHSASGNGHTSADVPGILRGYHEFHTVARGWSDIAYNFLVDSEGQVWEGRAGSLDGAVMGDATGGNQGFSQLVCVIGDYEETTPTQASLDSLVVVLSWLADRNGIDTAAGSTASFISRGSNRWPPGAHVVTPTITGHRSMSLTVCPGRNLAPYVAEGLMNDVTALRSSPPSTSTSPATSADRRENTKTTVTTTSAALPPPEATGVTEASGTSGLLWLGGVAAALGAGFLVWRHQRML